MSLRMSVRTHGNLVDGMNFDPLNVLLLAVALVVFWRLRSVLGTRTGTEKPPFDPFASKRTEVPPRQDGRDNVVRLPQNTSSPELDDDRESGPRVWEGHAEAGSPLALGLEKLAAQDPGFSPRSFIEGAKIAYEMILDAFAKGDKASLKNLLSKDVFDGFAQAIDEREAEGQRVESRFVGIDKTAIRAASLTGSKAMITVEFVSELISATYDRANNVIDGDPKQIREVTDIWSFERDVTSRNPNWKLASTQAPY
jgi:predicted lipid-binding transport protein (Tim44 family)